MAWISNLPREIKAVLRDVRNEIIAQLGDVEVVFWLGHIERGKVLDLYERRQEIFDQKTEKLIFVFDSLGGDADAAYQLTQLLKAHCCNLEIVVPVMAKSAGTLVCLAAEKIHMTPISELGPLDTQVLEPGEMHLKGALDEYQALIHVRVEAFRTLDMAVGLIINRSGGMSVPDVLIPASSFVAELLRPLYQQVDPRLLGKRARQLDVGFQYALKMINGNSCYCDPDRYNWLADKLVYGYPSHSFVIDYSEAKELGLPVEKIDPGPAQEVLVQLLNAIRGEDLSIIGSFVDEDRQDDALIAPSGVDGLEPPNFETTSFLDGKEVSSDDINKGDDSQEGTISQTYGEEIACAADKE